MFTIIYMNMTEQRSNSWKPIMIYATVKAENRRGFTSLSIILGCEVCSKKFSSSVGIKGF